MFVILLLLASAPASPRVINDDDHATARIQGWTQTITDMELHIRLDSQGWTGLGPLSFQHLLMRESLEVCVWIASTRLENRTRHEAGNFARMQTALRDPAIVGMYETAGATFRWERKVESFLLCKDVGLTQPQDAFNHEIDELLDVGLEWKLEWFFEVAMIMHGNKPLPTTRQTRSILVGPDPGETRLNE